MRYSDPKLIPENVVRLMSPNTRQELGLVSPEERDANIAIKLERDLQRQCEGYLRIQEIEFLHLSPMAREKQGWPDLVFAVNGIPHAIELKSEHGKLSDDQQQVLRRMSANGWRTFVIRSFPEFMAIIKERKSE